jgi:uncharacterized protein YjbI with pentapeptide repeats
MLNFTNAKLINSNLKSANLSFANLSGADISYANLTDADLYGADLTNAILKQTILVRADLRNANYNIKDLVKCTDILGLKITEDNQFINEMQILVKNGARIYGDSNIYDNSTTEVTKNYLDEDDIY